MTLSPLDNEEEQGLEALTYNSLFFSYANAYYVSVRWSESISGEKIRGRSRKKDKTLIAMLAPSAIASIQLTIGGVSRSLSLAMLTLI